MGKKIMWSCGEFWGIKNDNRFRLEAASAPSRLRASQLDVFNACEATRERKRDSSLNVPVHLPEISWNKGRAQQETGTFACGTQVLLE